MNDADWKGERGATRPRLQGKCLRESPAPQEKEEQAKRDGNHHKGHLRDQVERGIAALAFGVTRLKKGADTFARGPQRLFVEPFPKLGVVCQMVRLDQTGHVIADTSRQLAACPRNHAIKRARADAHLGRHLARNILIVGFEWHGAGDIRRRVLREGMLSKLTYPSDAAGTPLLIAHGLYGSARNWGVVAKRLSAGRPVTSVDMRNHGESPWQDSQSYPDMATDLASVIDERMDVLGHSMGGKAAMVLALAHPEKVRKLIVADIAPVAYSHTQMPMIDAMRAIDLADVEKRSDADQQLATRVEDPGIRAFLLQSLDVREKRWRLNLDVLAREMDRIVGFPEVEGVFDGPVLFLSGAESDYVLREHRDRIRTLFPKAVFAKIPGAGHWLHAEKPREFEAAVDAFLSA